MVEAVVIGAANMDIGARASSPLVMRDSNPGTVWMTPGGVGYNIARNLLLLGVDTALVTALGDDVFADLLRCSAAEAGLDLSESVTVPGAPTSTYVYLAEPDGDMAAAVNDMRLCAALTPEALAPRLDWINSARLAVVDANLPAESLAWLAEHCTVPLVADPVSVAKAGRLRAALPRLWAVKPNRAEAAELTGAPVRTVEEAFAAAEILLDKGVRQVYISLSSDGVAAAERGGGRVHVPCPPVKPVSTTGGGDAMTAALAASLLRSGTLEQSAHRAAGAGALACTTEAAVCPTMSWKHIEEIVRR